MTAPRGTDRVRPAYRASVAALAGAQKVPRGVSLYTRHVNRPAGRRLAAAADVLGLGPNQVTVLSAACSLSAVSVVALVTPGPAVGAVASALLVLGFFLDSADGQLARLRGGGSHAGEWLDHMADGAVKLLLHLAVAVAWFRLDVSPGALLVPLGFAVVAALLFFGGTLAGVLRERADRPGDAEPGGGAPAWALLPTDHGVLCLTFLLWGWQPLFTAAYAGLLAVNAAYLLAFGRHWFRRLS